MQWFRRKQTHAAGAPCCRTRRSGRRPRHSGNDAAVKEPSQEMLINLCHPPGMRRQFIMQTNARTLLFTADLRDAPQLVVVQIQTVAVAVAQHFQPLALR